MDEHTIYEWVATTDSLHARGDDETLTDAWRRAVAVAEQGVISNSTTEVSVRIRAVPAQP